MQAGKSLHRRASDVAMAFDGSRLRLARQLAGLRKNEVAQRVGKSPTAVAGWESGAKRPTPAVVGELALALSVDPVFFATRGHDVDSLGSTPHFRSLRSTTQLARDKALAFGQVTVDISTLLERYVEFPDPDIPASPVSIDKDSEEGPEEAARLVRAEWGLGAGPIRHMVRLLENHGVLVVFSPGWSTNVDAYSFESLRRPAVVLNPAKRDYYRQRFDVAHELGHLVMHADAEPGGRTVEEQANRFAAEFLAPEAAIAPELPHSMNPRSWAEIAKLKEHWGISIQALLFRARALGRIGDVAYRNAMATVSARGWRRNEPGLLTVLEHPSLLPRAVEVLRDEAVEIDELIRQCGVPPALFEIVTSRVPVSNAGETPTHGSDESVDFTHTQQRLSLAD